MKRTPNIPEAIQQVLSGSRSADDVLMESVKSTTAILGGTYLAGRFQPEITKALSKAYHHFTTPRRKGPKGFELAYPEPTLTTALPQPPIYPYADVPAGHIMRNAPSAFPEPVHPYPYAHMAPSFIP